MSIEETKIYITNKIWEYNWAINSLALDDNEKIRFRAKCDALYDILIKLKQK